MWLVKAPVQPAKDRRGTSEGREGGWLLMDKIRVHALAKELGVPVNDVLARLKAQNVIVRSGSSTISRRVERWLRDSYRTRVAHEFESPAAVKEPSHVRMPTMQTNTYVRTAARKPKKARKRPNLPRRSGIPYISKERITESNRSAADPEKVRKRIKELNAPEQRRPKTEAEKASDAAATESMRSYKPSSWRLGRSPGSYG